MAEGTSTSSGNTVCPFSYYSSGEQDRSASRFPQNSTRSSSNTPCRYFKQGRCVFGDKCWNTHIATQARRDPSPVKSDPRDRHVSPPGPSRQVPAARENSAPTKVPTRKDKYEPKFCSLTPQQGACGYNPPNWVNAPEFVPRTTKSYADTLKSNSNCIVEEDPIPVVELCTYYMDGECPFGPECPYIHGELCEICQKSCLHPFDENQRRIHTELCEKELEQDMELSFAVQRSKDKACGICMDVIMEKEPVTERRFGILEKCNHIFCLDCIRKWRKVKSFDSNPIPTIDSALDPDVTRACPECRIASDFITPSQFWIDTEEEKTKLIADYKVNLSQKPCKYFKQGKGTCPFGGACFYLHAKPDGTKVELPPPVRRRRQNQDGEIDYMGRIYLWDYVDFREEQLMLQLELENYRLNYNETWETGSDTSEASETDYLISDPF